MSSSHAGAVLLGGTGDLLGRGDVPVPVPLEHDLDPVADRLADPPEGLEALAHLVGGDVAPRPPPGDRVEWPDLHAPDAFVEQLLGKDLGLVELGPQILERTLALAEPVELAAPIHRAAARVVGGNAVVGEAAEHLPDRRPERLAEDVPERGIDRRQGPHLDARAAPTRRVVGVDRVPVAFDLARVLAEEERCRPRMDGRPDGLRHVVGVAGPDEALVGVHADEDQERDRVDLDGLECGDLHDLLDAPLPRVALLSRQPRRVVSAIRSTARTPAGIGRRQRDEPVDHAGEAAHVDRHAGSAELVAEDLALVAERVEGRGDDEGRWQVAQIGCCAGSSVRVAARVRVRAEKVVPEPHDVAAGQPVALGILVVGEGVEIGLGGGVDQDLEVDARTALVAQPKGGPGAQVAAGAVAAHAQSRRVATQLVAVGGEPADRGGHVVELIGVAVLRREAIGERDDHAVGRDGDPSAQVVVRLEVAECPAAAVQVHEDRPRQAALGAVDADRKRAVGRRDGRVPDGAGRLLRAGEQACALVVDLAPALGRHRAPRRNPRLTDALEDGCRVRVESHLSGLREAARAPRTVRDGNLRFAPRYSIAPGPTGSIALDRGDDGMRTQDLLSLEGKRALITGGGRGLGRALAVGFAQVGASIVIVGRPRRSAARHAADGP